MRFIGGLILALALMLPAAQAEEFGVESLRFGALYHSIDEPGPGGALLNFTRLQDVQVELLFTSPDNDFFRFIGSPMPSVGATLNLGGLESMAHAGLTWQANIFDTPFFVEGTLGAAVHNGALTGAAYPARSLGCQVLFYESASLGYQVNENFDIMVTWEHASSAKICAPNRGLTNIGLKLGYNFQ